MDDDEWGYLATELRRLNPRLHDRVLRTLRDLVLAQRVRGAALVRFLALRQPVPKRRARRA
jgi:hypothetical protein